MSQGDPLAEGLAGPAVARSAGTRPPRHLVALLAAFTSLVILTTDVYLPVLPRLGHDLGTSDTAAAATVSAVLVGIAVGQVIIGPLSDALGRRTPLLVGALAYVVMHVLASVAPNIAVLLAIRALTGLATAACIVVARAVVADLYAGSASARAFATLGAVTAIVPVIAPVSGGLLAHVMSWRGMFLLLAAIGLVVAAIGWKALPETLPRERRIPPHIGPVVRDLGRVFGIRRYLAYVAAVAGSGGVLFAYIGASSFVLEDVFGLSPQGFSIVFAGNSVGLLATNWITRHLVRTLGPARLLLSGQLLAITGCAVLAIGVATTTLAVLLIGLFATICSIGLVMPMATSLGMAAAAGRAGSASGVIGICQFAVGAAASPLAGLAGSAWSLVIVMGASAVLGLAVRLAFLHSAPESIDARSDS